MKIKRFVAPDMRQAMREVREEQGPEAVILSTRRLDEGIELIAAIDYDEALVREAARHGASHDAPAPMPAAAEPTVAPPVPPELRAAQRDLATRLSRAPAVAASASEVPAIRPLMERAAQDTTQMRAELGSLREMLEMQLSSLAWNDMERRHPLRARVLRELTRLGIDADVARQLADDLLEQISPEQARYLPLGMLSRSVAISGRGDSDGGMIALVGPTGVGKTTTIAKLAARAVVRHGANNVALVSTDHYRIGAAAQLEHYGRLLGVRVYPADDAASLRQVLEMLKGKHTVLIDTAGVSGTDPRLEQQMDVLNEVAHSDGIALRISLVLAANAQSQSLEDAVRAYAPLEPASVVFTKLDEAPSLGGALSVLIRHKLPLDYTTDGQRVPEDLAVADARVLVLRAAHALKTAASVAAIEDSALAERFGFAVAHA